MTPRADTTVVVVGGGIAGLAAARTAALAGASVVVLEPDHVGGKLRTSAFAGRQVDEGADAFLARVPWAVDLARDLGLGGGLVAPATGRAAVFVDGALRALPAEHLMGVPTDPDAADVAAILSAEGVAALAADVTSPGAPPAADEAIGVFVRRRLGDEVLDRLVGPLVGGINAGDPERMSLAAVTPQIDAAARVAGDPSLVHAAAAQRAAGLASSSGAPVFLAPTGGMARLVEALVADLVARGVELRVGVAVRALEPRAEGGWRVIADPSSGRGVVTDLVVDADAIVVAAPAPVAAALVRDRSPEAGLHLASIRHASCAIVALAIDPADLPTPDAPQLRPLIPPPPPHRPDAPLDAVAALPGSGFLVPRSAGLLLTACSWASSKWASLAPELGDGTVLLRASAGRDGDDRIAEMSDTDLVEHLIDDLVRTMDIEGTTDEVRVTRWPSSFPQYDVGHLARIDAVDADLAACMPGVAVAGMALRGVGIPASIRSGQEAAARALAAATPPLTRGLPPPALRPPPASR